MPLPLSSMLARRHVRVRESFEGLGIDALLVGSAANIRYLTNHVGTAGVAVITREAVHLLVDPRYRESVRQLQESEAACAGLRVWDVPASYDEAVAGCLAELDLATVGFEAAHVSVARHEWWRSALAARHIDTALQPTQKVVETARLVKDETEIAILRDAAQRLDSVMPAVLASVRAGVPERRVANAVETALREAGYDRVAFDTIVASGPNGALPHHRAGDRCLAGGDLVVLDFGGVLDGYCCDLTRTVSIGAPSAEAQRVYDAVRASQAAAIDAVRAGASAAVVDTAARSVLVDRGLGEAFAHATGHGLGLEVHEDPRLGQPRPDAPSATLEAGMVVTIEPGAYIPGWGGVRIEDDVLVTSTGCELLTRIPRELMAL